MMIYVQNQYWSATRYACTIAVTSDSLPLLVILIGTFPVTNTI